MAAVTLCPCCNSTLRLADNLLGQPFRCPKCNVVLSLGAPARNPESVECAAAADSPPVGSAPTATADADPHRTRTYTPTASMDAVPPASVAPNIPGYEILGILGRGGMGVVYQARQTKLNLNRVVALKMILAGSHATPDQLARFRTEAQAVARLQHRNIVQIYEVGEYDGLPYFSLEFCAQGSLAAQLRRGPMLPARAAALTATLARAIHAAHEHKIVHRDLKPANVLLTAAGEPKITDFGLAKKQDDGSGQTQSGAILGTPSYMAPEQAAGKIKEVGPAADIYALGAVLYEVLTGAPPFRADTPMDVVLQILSREPVPPRQRRPNVPADLQTICLKCLAKEPAQRYATAEALADDLERFLADKPIMARRASRRERAWRWCRRNPVVAGLSAAVAGVLCLGMMTVGVGVVLGILLQKRADEAQEQLDQAAADRKREEDARHRQKADTQGHLEYLADMRAAYQAWDKEDSESVRKLLDRHLPAAEAKDYRLWEWYFLRGLGKKVEGIPAEKNPIELRELASTAWTRDSQRLVMIDRDWELIEWDPGTATQKRRSSALKLAAWNPNGRALAASYSDRTIKVWQFAGGKNPLRLTGHTAEIKRLSWSPDGRRLALLSADGMICVWDGQERIAVAAPPSNFRLGSFDFDPPAFYWSANGQRLACVGRTASGRVLDLEKRTDFELPNGTDRVAWTSDGRQLAFCPAGSPSLRIWDAVERKPVRDVPGFINASVHPLTCSPDGSRIAISAFPFDAEIDIIDSQTGKPLRKLTAPKGPASQLLSLSWSPDAKYLAAVRNNFSAGTTIQLWDTDTGERIHSLPTSANINHAVYWSRDGKTVALIDNRAMTGWDVTTGKGTQHLSVGYHDLTRSWIAAVGQESVTIDQPLGGRERSQTPLLSPDGEQVAASRGEGKDADGQGWTIQVWNLAARKEIFGRMQLKTGAILAWSPDSKRLASADAQGTVEICHVFTGQVSRLADEVGGNGHVFPGPGPGTWPLVWRPDGQCLAFPGADNTVVIWDVLSACKLHALRGHERPIVSLAWSADGRRLASSSQDGATKIWTVATQAIDASLPGGSHIAWSPDGGRFVSEYQGKIRLWDTTLWKEAIVLPGRGPFLWSPDGRRLLVQSSFGGKRAGSKHVVWQADLPAEGPAASKHAPNSSSSFGAIRFSTLRIAAGQAEIKVEVQLTAPVAHVKDVAVHYRPASEQRQPLPPGDAASVPALPGATTVRLTIDQDRAVGTFTCPFPEQGPGTILFQTSHVGWDGQRLYELPDRYALDNQVVKARPPAPMVADFQAWALPDVPKRKPLARIALTADIQEFPLEAKYRDVAVGGGGRYLVFQHADGNKLSIFDVSQTKTVASILLREAAPADHLIAAGMDMVVAVERSTGVIKRWSLPEGKMEAGVQLPWTRITSIAMGSASRGPVLLGRPGPPGNQLGQSQLKFVDLSSLRPLNLEVRFKGFDDKRLHPPVHVRAAADGRTFCLIGSAVSPNGVMAVVLAEQGAVASSWHRSASHAVPAPDGRILYTSDGGWLTAESDSFGPTLISGFVLPAADGEHYLSIPQPRQWERVVNLRGTLERVGQTSPVQSLDLGTLPQWNPWAQPADAELQIDKRVHLLPEAGVVVLLPATNDRVALYRLKPES
jgi:WD40 repeat protein